MEDEPHWSIDRRVPIAVLVAMFMQFGGLVWWVSGVVNRVENLEKFTAEIASTRQININRITVLEQQLLSMRAQLDRIEKKLDK